jgi:hypothetical protein
MKVAPIAQLNFVVCIYYNCDNFEARCLLQLPLIVKPVVASLKSVNDLTGYNLFMEDHDGTVTNNLFGHETKDKK